VRPVSVGGFFSKAVTELRSTAWISEVPSTLIFTIIVVAPFPFASVAPAAVSILCACAGLAIIGIALQRPALPSPAVFTSIILLLVTAYSIVLYLQVVPRQPADHLVNPIWAEASRLIGTPLEAGVSVVRDQPFFAVGTPLLTLMMFVGGYFCGADDELSRRLIRVTAWAGGIYAVYAIGSYAIEPTMVLWREKDAYTSNLTGTFTNRNAAAVYFGSISTLWLIIFFRRLELKKSRRSRRNRTSSQRYQLAIPVVFFLITLFATLLTGSRAGAACSAAGLLVAFVITFRRNIPTRYRRIALLGAAAFSVAMIYQVFNSSIGDRLQSEGLAGGGRSTVMASVLRMIADTPVLGTGLGTFRWSFSAYRSGNISGWGIYDKAHNVMLEIAAEGGIPLAAIILLVWAIAVGIMLLSTRQPHVLSTRQPHVPALVIGGLSVATVASLHSLVDFSMQIPGYAVNVATIVGAGVSRALRHNEITILGKVDAGQTVTGTGND
jgi:O-antigen ligase